eukprot:4176276-Pleurochrysis_carterae.AAC.1
MAPAARLRRRVERAALPSVGARRLHRHPHHHVGLLCEQQVVVHDLAHDGADVQWWHAAPRAAQLCRPAELVEDLLDQRDAPLQWDGALGHARAPRQLHQVEVRGSAARAPAGQRVRHA